MSEKLNILHVASWFPSEKEPMLGNFIERHVEAASDHTNGWVLYAVPHEEDRIDISEGENFKKCLVYFKRKRPIVDHYMALERGFDQIAKRDFYPDMIHLHVTYPAGQWVIGRKLPFVVTEHFTGFHDYSDFKWSPYRKWTTSRILNKAQRILPVSERLGEAITKFRVKSPMQKVSNVVATCFYPAAQHLETKPLRFLHVSSLVNAQKNITGLLTGFKLAQDAGLDFHLTIGGDGDVKLLEKWIYESGLDTSRITTFGMSTPQQIAELMRANHCFVLFSNVENQPVVILEALSTGIPVISTDVGGIFEELKAENGNLIAAKNTEALKYALLDMQKSIHQYSAKTISAEALAKYSRKAVGATLLSVYQQVLADKR